MRLCIANRFARAASMSLRWGEVNVVLGLQRWSCHWFVHAYAYSRSGRRVAVSLPTVNGSLLVQLCTAMALLPRVVSVGAFVRALTSHGSGDAGLATSW